MIELKYSLVIEGTKTKWGMIKHVNLLKEKGLRVPPKIPTQKLQSKTNSD
jgi:hypothetical protein